VLGISKAGFAQDTAASNLRTPQRYIKAGLGMGSEKNFGLYVSLVTSEKRFYTFDFNMISRNPKYLPQGYYGEFLCIFGDCIPNDETSYITFFAGYYFINKRKMRLGGAAGPSFVNFKKVIFKKREVQGWGFNLGPNYNTSFSNRVGAGLALKAMMEFQILKWLWLEPAFYANVNTQHTTCSGNLFVSFNFPVKR